MNEKVILPFQALSLRAGYDGFAKKAYPKEEHLAKTGERNMGSIIQEPLGHRRSKATKIPTRVSYEDPRRITNPLDTLFENKNMDGGQRDV